MCAAKTTHERAAREWRLALQKAATDTQGPEFVACEMTTAITAQFRKPAP